MQNIVIVILTLILVSFIIFISKKIENQYFKGIKYRQSDLYLIFNRNIKINNKVKKQSQSSQRLQNNSLTVIIIDGKAYWVSNNIFYCADFIDNEVQSDTAKPVDTENMSKEDINKMMFILDKLGSENQSDSGSTG